jgi:hypothetical protein
MMVVMLVIVIVAAALLIIMMVVAMAMAMAMLMIVLVTATLFVIVVVMVMLVVMAAALFVIVMVMVVVLVVMAAALVVVMMMVVAMAMAMAMLVTAALLAILVVVMMVLGLLSQASQLGLQGILALHSLQELGAGQLVPGGGDDDGGGVVLTQEGDGGLHLGGGHGLGMGEDDATGVLHLVVEELTKVLHVHLALACVHHGGKSAQHSPFGGGALDGADDVGQLAHARGLDEDAVGGVLGQHLGESLTEVTHQGAADTARVHFVDLDTRLGQKSAVDTDLAELVLNEHQLLTGVSLGDELLDQGRFTGTQKSGENVNFRHSDSLLFYM